MAQRRALDVVAHNVANANTDGYARQEAVLQASPPYPFPTADRYVGAGQLGTGVDVLAIRRIRDQLLDYQVREQYWALGNSETTRSYLEQIELIVNEPSDSGINTLLNKMWASWYDLSNNPDSYIAKAAVVQTSTVLADAIKRLAGQVEGMRLGTDQEIGLKLSDVTSALAEIDELNRKIATVTAIGDDANDLRDQRDLLLDQISRVVQIGYQEEASGAVTVWLGTPKSGAPGSAPLLVEMGGTPAVLRWDEATGQVLSSFDGAPEVDVTAQVLNGELKALIDLRVGELDPTNASGFAGRLELFADALIAEVNQIVNPLGTGVDFFTPSAGDNDAQLIRVNPAVVADPQLVPAGTSGEPGDGSIALAVAQLQNTEVSIAGTSVTLGGWYHQLVSKLGIDSNQAAALATNQGLLVDHLTNRRESVSGVSLDEEAANMVRFERAYQAASRVMTAMDEMLDKLVNGTGIVGR